MKAPVKVPDAFCAHGALIERCARDLVVLVRKMRTAQRHFEDQRSRVHLESAVEYALHVDALLATFGVTEIEEPQQDFFERAPAISEYLRRNPAAARVEAKARGKRAERAAKRAGLDAERANAIGEEAFHAFLRAVAKGAR